ncbi:hypothetical protein [Peribacillus frigoritolerans]|uniref:hypothetical protein n=1 Tax=Peribacillus frigoritolerans TaxID=450367 RepID=UPI003019ACA6
MELHKYSINKHILPYFKNILLQDVKPIMYQKFLNFMAKIIVKVQLKLFMELCMELSKEL